MLTFYLSLVTLCLMLVAIALQMWKESKNKQPLIDVASVIMWTGVLLMMTGIWLQYRSTRGGAPVAPQTTASIQSAEL